MKPHTKESQAAFTPATALEELKAGNKRFVRSAQLIRDLGLQVQHTSTGQFPFATVLHCIDSRVSAELIFDQGIGDLFSIRIAGNFVNDDILGSMEFACKLAGTKVLVVLGHTACGAVKGACDHARLGNLTTLIQKLELAVEAVPEPGDPSQRNSANIDFVNASLETVLSYLQNRSRSLDRDGKGLSIIYVKPTKKDNPNAVEKRLLDEFDIVSEDEETDTGAEKLITIEIENVPLIDAVRYICAIAGLEYSVEEHALIVSPNDLTDNQTAGEKSTDTPDLYISELVHKAFIEVNEAGTEAAAATAIIFDGEKSETPEYPTFRANRPFIYMIKDNITDTILFMGRMTKPSE